MKNFDKIFDESIPVHQNPLGPIRVLDEESSSKTKRNADKICSSVDGTPGKDANALSFFEITLHRCRVAQGQNCTVAGLHRSRVAQGYHRTC